MFALLTTVGPKMRPLTFLVITQKRYILDMSNYIFSESLGLQEYFGIIFYSI